MHACGHDFHTANLLGVNDERLTNIVKDVACSLYGESGGRTPGVISGSVQELIKIDGPRLAAEDFGFYSQKIPSCLYWVGAGILPPLYSSDFTVNEDIVKSRFRLCLRLLWQYCSS
jgi:metal-dependent amidase/aminoacylase/carboxypeptidase family protein